MDMKKVLVVLVTLLLLSSSVAFAFANNTTTNSRIMTAVQPAEDLIEEVIPPFCVIFKNKTIIRCSTLTAEEKKYRSTSAPIGTPDPLTGVTSTDTPIWGNLSARVYLPDSVRYIDPGHPAPKLPILVYYHGGGFIVGSAADFGTHRFLNKVVSQAFAMFVSINYRLFPEWPLPAAYIDGWPTLHWVANQRCLADSVTTSNESFTILPDLLLKAYGDYSRLYLAGDDVGANIIHNVAMQIGKRPLCNDIRVRGVFMITPYFLSAIPLPFEERDDVVESTSLYRIWKYVYPPDVCPYGFVDPKADVLAPGAPSYADLDFDRIIAYSAELDPLRGRAVWYLQGIQKGSWKGKSCSPEGRNVTHSFPIFEPDHPETFVLVTTLTRFIQAR